MNCFHFRPYVMKGVIIRINNSCFCSLVFYSFNFPAIWNDFTAIPINYNEKDLSIDSGEFYL